MRYLMENWRFYLKEQELSVPDLEVSDEEEIKNLSKKVLDKFQDLLDIGGDGFSDYEMTGHEMNQWLEKNKTDSDLDKKTRSMIIKGKFVMDEIAGEAWLQKWEEVGLDGMQEILGDKGHTRGMEYYNAFVQWVGS
ncbi:MAG: hypothetical protein VXZ58_00755 [Actinomycetota bacterium]|nr:hypothetical protein [Actinomycetota bacterium]